MTVQQLIDEFSKAPDKSMEVWVQCYSGNYAWAFYPVESVQRQQSGRTVLNIPGATLPESTDGAIA